MRRTLSLLAAATAAALVVGAALAARPQAPSPVSAFPSSQTLPGTGALPAGGTGSVSLAAARGEREGAWIVVPGPGQVAAQIEAGSLGEIRSELAWGHFVSVNGKRVADALIPWDGAARAAEQPNQPLFVRVFVPATVAPGTYTGAVDVTVNGAEPVRVPLQVRVFPFTLPDPAKAAGNLLTSFHVSPETYVNTAARLYNHDNDARQSANASLFRLFAQYRLGPSSWGFGEPKTAAGYAESKKWWLDSAGNMAREVEAAGGGFAAMRIPLSSNRASVRNYVAGLSPSEPEKWCDYLKATRAFWEQRGWLAGTVQYAYGQDEPGLEGQKLVARQSKAVHECWPGGRSLMTGNPSPSGANAFLSDGQGGDDLDIWVVLSRRWYGQFTVPSQQKDGKSRARELNAPIEQVRKRGKQVWSYTYSGIAGTPGFAATEPLSNGRVFLLWNALEGTDGVLYGQGTTNYGKGDPLDAIDKGGDFILLYPGDKEPIPSARLEQIRDGIEDWSVFEAIRRKQGAAKVRAILGAAGIFSADAKGVKLACDLGCELKGDTKYSWPRWSSDATTAGKIEQAKLAALQVAR